MKSLTRIFLFFFAFCACAGTAFGELVDVNLRFVWLRIQDVSAPFYVKFGEQKKIEGSFRSLGLKSQKYRGENRIALSRKTEQGEFEICADIEIPKGIRDAAVIFVPDSEAPEGEPRFRACVLDLAKQTARGGDIILANLSEQTLRAKINDGKPVKYLPGESKKLHSVPAGSPSETFGFKIVAAAASKEAAKKSWRYTNSMKAVPSQCYFLVVLPGPAVEEGKPPRCELISLREERN